MTDDTKVSFSYGGKTVATSAAQIEQAAAGLYDAVAAEYTAPGEPGAFDLPGREYRCRVEKITVPRHEDKDSGYIDQLTDMVFAVEVRPEDLKANGLSAAAYEYNSEAEAWQAAPGDLVKLKRTTKCFNVEIGTETDSGDCEWSLLAPATLVLSGVVPDADKLTLRPGAELLIAARGLPFHLAGELWYPNSYRLRFIRREAGDETTPDDRQTNLEDFAREGADG